MQDHVPQYITTDPSDLKQKFTMSEIKSQLLQIFPQFCHLRKNFGNGLFIIYKWAYDQKFSLGKNGGAYTVELLDLADCTSHFRVWDVKDDLLLNDYKAPNTIFGLCRSNTSDWWQELSDQGLDLKKNHSLQRAIFCCLTTLHLSSTKVEVLDCSCRPIEKYRSFEKGLQYKVRLNLFDTSGKIKRLSFIVNSHDNLRTFMVLQHIEDGVIPTSLNKSAYRKEWEDLVQLIRMNMIGSNLAWSSDMVVYYYYFDRYEKLENQQVRATFEILLINQIKKMHVVSGKVWKTERSFEITDTQNRGHDGKLMEQIFYRGCFMGEWQQFSKLNFSAKQEYIQRSIIAGIKAFKGKIKFEEVLSTKCRIVKNRFTAGVEKFEYMLQVKYKDWNLVEVEDQWIIEGDPSSLADYRFLSSSKVNIAVQNISNQEQPSPHSFITKEDDKNNTAFLPKISDKNRSQSPILIEKDRFHTPQRQRPEREDRLEDRYSRSKSPLMSYKYETPNTKLEQINSATTTTPTPPRQRLKEYGENQSLTPIAPPPQSRTSKLDQYIRERYTLDEKIDFNSFSRNKSYKRNNFTDFFKDKNGPSHMDRNQMYLNIRMATIRKAKQNLYEQKS